MNSDWPVLVSHFFKFRPHIFGLYQKMSGKNRHFKFTKFDMSREDMATLIDTKIEGQCYYCLGNEICPDTGKPHLQCHISFTNPRSIKPLIAVLSEGTHCHVTVADYPYDSMLYCQEDGDFIEWGTPLKQVGKKGGQANMKRWDDARAAAQAGRPEDVPSDIYIKHLGNIDKLVYRSKDKAKDFDSEFVRKENNILLVGVAGSGKSTMGPTLFPGRTFRKPMSKWFDAYDGEETIMLEDLDPTNAMLMSHHIKIWGDRFAFVAESKGVPSVVIR